MRSKIGIKSRLAAHILALILLIIMLVYLAPPQSVRARPAAPAVQTAAASQPTTPAVIPAPVAPTPSANTAEPAASESETNTGIGQEPALPAEQENSGEKAPTESSEMPIAPQEQPDAAAPSEPATKAPPPDVAQETPATQESEQTDDVADSRVEEPSEPAESLQPATHSETEPPISSLSDAEPPAPETPSDEIPDIVEPPFSEPDVTPAPEASVDEIPNIVEPPYSRPEPSSVGDEQPAPNQPDESGSLVVAASDTGTAQSVVSPLYNANLEVLGDGVYWLGSQHDADLEKELKSIPGLSDLVILARLPGAKIHDIEHVKTTVIPSDTADLSLDAAERFLHFTSDRAKHHITDNSPKPVVVVAAQSGARGAAFYKGVYLLFNRNLSFEEIEKEIEPELEEAGPARDEIIHRLKRLKNQ